MYVDDAIESAHDRLLRHSHPQAGRIRGHAPLILHSGRCVFRSAESPMFRALSVILFLVCMHAVPPTVSLPPVSTDVSADADAEKPSALKKARAD